MINWKIIKTSNLLDAKRKQRSFYKTLNALLEVSLQGKLEDIAYRGCTGSLLAQAENAQHEAYNNYSKDS